MMGNPFMADVHKVTSFQDRLVVLSGRCFLCGRRAAGKRMSTDAEGYVAEGKDLLKGRKGF
jgi:hypothetical protein